ncbi:hypothetical protein E2C01_013393 [Portunus trituberculatus]|uniref:Uncharacterized protein n=1 Tax=Portunus trituberculatus TaxID=210409 RepID=A0A5B7DGI9_PORTR|nr:hypothetical protein [Portunus trituberculatus]
MKSDIGGRGREDRCVEAGRGTQPQVLLTSWLDWLTEVLQLMLKGAASVPASLKALEDLLSHTIFNVRESTQNNLPVVRRQRCNGVQRNTKEVQTK